VGRRGWTGFAKPWPYILGFSKNRGSGDSDPYPTFSGLQQTFLDLVHLWPRPALLWSMDIIGSCEKRASG